MLLWRDTHCHDCYVMGCHGDTRVTPDGILRRRNPVTARIQIQNESKLPAKFSFLEQEGGSKGLASLTVMPPSGSLAARASREVSVTLTPACLGRIQLPIRLKVLCPFPFTLQNLPKPFPCHSATPSRNALARMS